MGWYFLWGPFRGGIFFGVCSEGILLCLLACLPYFRNASCLEELDQRNLWWVKLLNNAIKDEIMWWGTLHSHHSSLLCGRGENLWRVKLQAGQQLRVSKFPSEQRRAFPLVLYKYNKKFWEELITYFLSTIIRVFDMTSRKKTLVCMLNAVNKTIQFERLLCLYYW
jgi:hypothetical protein